MMIMYADHFARSYHEGQFRKGSKEPYYNHVVRVAQLIEKYGIHNDESICIALLHDTVEDTDMTFDLIRQFGPEVEMGVRAMTKTEYPDRQSYVRSFETAPYNIQMIKLCDTLDNAKTIDVLDPESLERKIKEYKNVFIPLAERVAPDIAKELKHLLKKYL
jgi:GTP pyrophosphokinase